MINLLSTVDGFKVILGTWIINATAFLILAFVIRPPEYEDDPDRQ